MDRNVSIREGSLPINILRMALPLAAGSILQQLFNAADVAVVGHFAGSEALAAVGANAPVISLFVNLLTGLAIGTNVGMANALGSGDEERASRHMHTSVAFSVWAGICMGVLGFFLAPTILRWITVPEEILTSASSYLKLYMVGMPFVMLYNFEAAAFRAQGDTRTPLYALLLSGGVNVALNLFFVAVLHWNVEGVAIATVLSNILSSGILYRKLTVRTGGLRLQRNRIRIEMEYLQTIIRIGLPTGIQGSMFAIANVVVQAGVNSLGAIVIAANAASVHYEYFGFYLISAFSAAAVTFVGQNYGAGDPKRCLLASHWCVFLGTVSMMLFAGICAWAAVPCMRFFTAESAVISLGVIRIRRVLTLQWINSIMEIQSGVLRGLGKSMGPAAICVLSICGFRIFWMATVFQKYHTFDCLIMAYPASWIISLAAVSILYVRALRKLAKRETLQKN